MSDAPSYTPGAAGEPFTMYRAALDRSGVRPLGTAQMDELYRRWAIFYEDWQVHVVDYRVLGVDPPPELDLLVAEYAPEGWVPTLPARQYDDAHRPAGWTPQREQHLREEVGRHVETSTNGKLNGKPSLRSIEQRSGVAYRQVRKVAVEIRDGSERR